MTREEFVRKDSWILAVIRDRCELTRAEKDYLDILIEVLGQEPCDCISRQAVLNIIDSYSNSQSNVEDVTQDCISDVMVLPSVQPKEKTGNWIEQQTVSLNNHKIMWFECSECGHKETNPSKMYQCEVCGAKMGSEE